jgi:hypothetical protein
MIKYPDIHDVDSLMSAIRAGFHPTYIFFWGHTAQETSIGKHVLSQWWPAKRPVTCQPTATQ